MFSICANRFCDEYAISKRTVMDYAIKGVLMKRFCDERCGLDYIATELDAYTFKRLQRDNSIFCVLCCECINKHYKMYRFDSEIEDFNNTSVIAYYRGDVGYICTHIKCMLNTWDVKRIYHCKNTLLLPWRFHKCT